MSEPGQVFDRREYGLDDPLAYPQHVPYLSVLVVLLASSQPNALSEFRRGWLLEMAAAAAAAVALLAARPRPRVPAAAGAGPAGRMGP